MKFKLFVYLRYYENILIMASTSNREEIKKLMDEQKNIKKFIDDATKKLNEQLIPHYERYKEIENLIRDICEHVWNQTSYYSEHTEYQCEVCGKIEPYGKVYKNLTFKK